MFSEFFSQVIVYLLAAILAVPVAKRLGLGSALGYIIAGIVIGPFILGFVGEEGQDVMHFAEFGVVLMLFLVGLELEPKRLWNLRVPILGMGGSQVILTTAVIALMAHWLGQDWRVSIAIGLILSLSSTAMVLQTLQEKSWMKTEAGRAGFSVLLFQDIAVVPILMILPFLAQPEFAVVTATGSTSDVPNWLTAVMILAAVLGIVVGGRFLLKPVFYWIASTRSIELFFATAMALVIGITMAMEAVGLSAALGTFLAGVVLADSEYRHELESTIEPFKGLLLGLFFIMVGASIDFGLLGERTLFISAMVAALILSKFALLLLLGRIFKLRLADNLMFAFILAQGGEFAFLLCSFATKNAVITPALADLLIVIVVLSMVITPLLIIFYERWVQPRFVDCVSEDPAEEEAMAHCPVIVAGYGRFGQVVSRLLHAGGIGTTLLDHDVGQVAMTGRFGYKVFYGDASRVELLKAAGAEEAKLLIIAMGDKETALKIVRTAKRHFPHLKVLSRAYDRLHNYQLIDAGADIVTRETFGSALILGEEALKALGMDDARAYRVMRTFKFHDEAGLEKLYELWGDDKAYGLRVKQSTEDVERVLQDDEEETENHFREAVNVVRNIESRRLLD